MLEIPCQSQTHMLACQFIVSVPLSVIASFLRAHHFQHYEHFKYAVPVPNIFPPKNIFILEWNSVAVVCYFSRKNMIFLWVTKRKGFALATLRCLVNTDRPDFLCLPKTQVPGKKITEQNYMTRIL